MAVRLQGRGQAQAQDPPLRGMAGEASRRRSRSRGLSMIWKQSQTPIPNPSPTGGPQGGGELEQIAALFEKAIGIRDLSFTRISPPPCGEGLGVGVGKPLRHNTISQRIN